MTSRQKGAIESRRDNKERTYDEREPLLSPRIIDPASQRLFVICIFVLIQCWKLYDIISIKTGVVDSGFFLRPHSGFTIVVKYAFIDGFFLWLLPLLNIPYLVLAPFETFLLTILINFFTLFLASDTVSPIISAFYVPFRKLLSHKKEMTLMGDKVNLEKVIDTNAYFRGKYTIHFLPDSSAKLNPFNYKEACFDSHSSAAFQLPIEFNSTNEIGHLQLQHLAPNNDIKYIEFNHRSLKKLMKKDRSHLRTNKAFVHDDYRVTYVEVPIREAGMYRISKVVDSNGVNIRSYKSDFFITYCPEASFLYPKDFDRSYNYNCVTKRKPENMGSLNVPMINIFGVSPLSLTYELKTDANGGRIYNLSVEDTSQSNSTQILKEGLGWLQHGSYVRNLLHDALNDVSGLDLSNTDALDFQLIEVRDAIGNRRQYNPLIKDCDLHYKMHLKEKPILSLHDYEPSKALLVNGTKRLWLPRNKFDVSDFPLNIVVRYEDFDRKVSYNQSKTINDNKALGSGISVDKPGLYSLVAARTRFCECSISDVPPIALKEAETPLFVIQSEPNIDKCVGTTGYKFDFFLKGKAPFIIEYEIYQNRSDGSIEPFYNERGLINRKLKSYENRYKFEYNPPAEGNYVIIFKGVRDFNYNRYMIPMDQQKYSYLIYFKQRSRASFFKAPGELQKRIKACLGDSVTVPVYFQGNPPFGFNYEIINSNDKEKTISTQRVSGINTDQYEIITPPFTKGGIYEARLFNLTDNINCPVDINKNEKVQIVARGDIPEVSMKLKEKETYVKIIEGDNFRIPLSLKSSIGWTAFDSVDYSYTSPTNNETQIRTLRNVNYIKAKEVGNYSLTGFTNEGCKGKVTQPERKVILNYYKRPFINVVTKDTEWKEDPQEKGSYLIDNHICQHQNATLTLELKGVKPFMIDYDIKLPSGKVETRSMQANNDIITIDLPTTTSGSYEHHFKAIYDRLYTRERAQRLLPMLRNPIIKYNVNSIPDISFPRTQYLQVCETDVRLIEKPLPEIPMEIKGLTPLSIEAVLINEATGTRFTFTINGITSRLSLRSILNSMTDKDLESLRIGEYLLAIENIQDARGCSRQDITADKHFLIAITKAPDISLFDDKSYYCVGDHISYNLSGLAPFNVYYEFNHNVRKAELGPIFRRLASRPGNLSVLALSDTSASSCLVNFTGNANKMDSLKIKIYDLPSVTINQGDYIVRDIHEGDQTEIKFFFSGTPPFRLKYTRTVESRHDERRRGHASTNQNNINVATKTIEDIWDYEYTIIASLEGTYEAIEVQDAYCIAKKDIVDKYHLGE